MRNYKYIGIFKNSDGHTYEHSVNCNGFIQAFFLLTADAIRSARHYQLYSITNEKNNVVLVDDITKVGQLLKYYYICSMKNEEERYKNKAYKLLKKCVLDYVKANFELLSAKYGITNDDIKKSRKNDNSIIEWLLGEYLDNNEFKELGITVVSDWGIFDENIHTTIYKIGEKYVRNSFPDKGYMFKHTFDFVKPVHKQVIVTTYETIQTNEK